MLMPLAFQIAYIGKRKMEKGLLCGYARMQFVEAGAVATDLQKHHRYIVRRVLP